MNNLIYYKRLFLKNESINLDDILKVTYKKDQLFFHTTRNEKKSVSLNNISTLDKKIII